MYVIMEAGELSYETKVVILTENLCLHNLHFSTSLHLLALQCSTSQHLLISGTALSLPNKRTFQLVDWIYCRTFRLGKRLLQ